MAGMAKPTERDQALAKALEEAGGVTAVAQFITENFEQPISPQAVSKWLSCPPRRMYQLEAAVKAKRGKTRARDLCPKVFEPAAA